MNNILNNNWIINNDGLCELWCWGAGWEGWREEGGVWWEAVQEYRNHQAHRVHTVQGLCR